MIQWFKNLRKLFWQRCHYCKQKKQWFYYIWETSKYDHNKNYTAEECEICTDCIIEQSKTNDHEST